MCILTLDKINFTYEDLVKNMAKKKSVSKSMLKIVKEAYDESIELVKPRSLIKFFTVEEIEEDGGIVTLADEAEKSKKYKLEIGRSAGHLYPASSVAMILSTVGAPIVAAMAKASEREDYIRMYYIDAFAVRALGEMNDYLRSYLEKKADENNVGIGPFMQPGAVAGWGVEGQRDIYTILDGKKIDLEINNAHFLIPNISDSAIVGMGDDYSAKRVGSMCHECPRIKTCLWRRENVSD